MSFEERLLKQEERAVFGMRELYTKYGYTPYKMSRFEEYDLYVRNKDFLVSDSVITFTGRNGKLFALKPDVTLSIIKNTSNSTKSLHKVYYNESVFRMSASTHEFAEIMQTGLECVGKIDTYNICEVIMLALRSLEIISPDYMLDLSHMGIVSSLLDSADISSETRSDLLCCIAQKNLSDIDRISKATGRDLSNIAKLVRCYGKPEAVLPGLDEICNGCDAAVSALADLKSILNVLKSNNASSNINLDFSVVNNMDYYNGIVFQGFIDTVPSGVLSGGQYDLLVKKMGKDLGAIGFAVYLDLLERLGTSPDENAGYDADILLIYDNNVSPADVIKTVNMFTEKGFCVISARDNACDNIKCRQTYLLNGKGLNIKNENA